MFTNIFFIFVTFLRFFKRFLFLFERFYIYVLRSFRLWRYDVVFGLAQLCNSFASAIVVADKDDSFTDCGDLHYCRGKPVRGCWLLLIYSFNNNNNNIHICIAPYGRNFRGAKCTPAFSRGLPSQHLLSYYDIRCK